MNPARSDMAGQRLSRGLAPRHGRERSHLTAGDTQVRPGREDPAQGGAVSSAGHRGAPASAQTPRGCHRSPSTALRAPAAALVTSSAGCKTPRGQLWTRHSAPGRGEGLQVSAARLKRLFRRRADTPAFLCRSPAARREGTPLRRRRRRGAPGPEGRRPLLRPGRGEPLSPRGRPPPRPSPPPPAAPLTWLGGAEAPRTAGLSRPPQPPPQPPPSPPPCCRRQTRAIERRRRPDGGGACGGCRRGPGLRLRLRQSGQGLPGTGFRPLRA